MKRKLDRFKPLFKAKPIVEPKGKPLDPELRHYWHCLMNHYIRDGVDVNEAQRRVNSKMNFPPDWSPAKGSPWKS